MATADPPIRILLVDDDEDDFLLTRELLAETREARYQLDWIPDVEAALDTICRDEHDLGLVDFRLGRITGLELIAEAHRRNCTMPMILLTGLGERAIDHAAMRAGFADYLEKGKLDAALLERAIRYTLQEHRHSQDLERKVRERTAELQRANAALKAEVLERQRAEAALREADRRKDTFLATLAHELRNPLVPIRYALEIMRLVGNRPDAVEDARAMIERQVKQMVHLIDDLLDISRISRGQIQLRRQPVALSEVVDSAVEASRPLIDAAGHTLRVRLPDEPITLDADPTRLSQVLLNLLNNAAKYTETGGRIDLVATHAGDQVEIRVRDTGIGIPPELFGSIFEIFTQGPRPESASPGGLGIGLSLVKSLVELHGGRVEVRSEGVGMGSEFIVRLPAPAPRPEPKPAETAPAA
jgi:signal transduction histidine kinase